METLAEVVKYVLLAASLVTCCCVWSRMWVEWKEGAPRATSAVLPPRTPKKSQ